MKMPPVTGGGATSSRVEPCKSLKLKGRVVSGRKRGTRNTRRDAGKLRHALGVAVVDGTLNIILKRPVMFANDAAIRIPVDDGGPPRREWPARLNGTPVWINRRLHPLHIISLLSDVHLRSHLHLSDGDTVQIEVRPSDVGPVSLAGRLTWILFWLGRKQWYYTRSGYLERAERWCTRFGATQLASGANCRGLSVALTKALIRGVPRSGFMMKSPASAGSGAPEPGYQGLDANGMIRLSGRVASGRGKASSYVERQADKIRDVLGERVVEGSLNIILKRPVMLRDDTAIKVAFKDELVRLHWPGRLRGAAVWLQRWPSAPLHIMELFCAVHLRTHLNLSDGDRVEIEARQCDMKPISNLGRVAWILLWFGRRKWHYTNDRYYLPAERWGSKFGATQLGTDKSFRDLAVALVKMMIKKIPGARLLRAVRSDHD
jgi:CTP-dependent riboflavin kinase